MSSFFGTPKGRTSKAVKAASSPILPIDNAKKYLPPPLPSNNGGGLERAVSCSETLPIEEDWETSHNASCDNLSVASIDDDNHHKAEECRLLRESPKHVDTTSQGPEHKKAPNNLPSSLPPLASTPVSSASFESSEEFWNLQEEDGLPPTLKRSVWSEVSPGDYPVRSATYLQNRKKLAADESVMSLWAVDLVQTDGPFSMCAHPHERLQRCLRRGTAPEFCFAVNICLPAPQQRKSSSSSSAKVKAAFYQFVAYFGVDNRARFFDQSTPVGRLAHKFCNLQDDDGDSFRNQTFKLIPRIVHGGGFVFRQAVGSKPVLLGQKVSQKYFGSQDYCEVLVDIASDPVAKRIVRMALGVATHLTIDLSFCLEGKTVETLPEQLLGGFRVQGLSFANDGQRYVAAVNQETL